MSRALTAAELIGAFRKWKLNPIEQDGWETHDRGPMDDVNGIIVHHTGDDVPDDRSWKVLWSGHGSLPGPLCQWGMRDDGRPHMMSARRANHAGKGSSVTLNHVRNEDYSGALRPGPDDIDGNGRYYGQETMYSGAKKMTREAYAGTILACAAICDAYTQLGSQWTGKSVIGHKEHSLRKVDPGNQAMEAIRADVDRALAMGPEKAHAHFFGTGVQGVPVAPLPPKVDPAAAVVGDIGKHYRDALGGAAGVLGLPTSQELTNPDGYGKRVDFERGVIYWTPETGAHEVHGAILEAYGRLLWERGAGYPLTDETVTPDGRGRYSVFQGLAHTGLVAIYWTPETGAQVVKGRVREQWAALGFEQGELGYPVGEETVRPDGVIEQRFEKGVIAWNPADDTFVA